MKNLESAGTESRKRRFVAKSGREERIMEGNDIKVEGYTVNTIECDPVVELCMHGEALAAIEWRLPRNLPDGDVGIGSAMNDCLRSIFCMARITHEVEMKMEREAKS